MVGRLVEELFLLWSGNVTYKHAQYASRICRDDISVNLKISFAAITD